MTDENKTGESTPEKENSDKPEKEEWQPDETLGREERQMGSLCHGLALLGAAFPPGCVIGPLLVWYLKKDSMRFVREQGVESLNFQILALLPLLLSHTLVLRLAPGMGWWISLVFYVLLVSVWMVVTIALAIRAGEGLHVKYPFRFRIFKTH